MIWRDVEVCLARKMSVLLTVRHLWKNGLSHQREHDLHITRFCNNNSIRKDEASHKAKNYFAER